jgi:hypothetical protein
MFEYIPDDYSPEEQAYDASITVILPDIEKNHSNGIPQTNQPAE